MTAMPVVSMLAAAILGQPAESANVNGFDWVRIGHAGNRPAAVREAEGLEDWLPIRLGGVEHEYRITKTVVTTEQWLEFVNAYWPYWDGPLDHPHFTTLFIAPTNPDPGPGEDPGYWIAEGAEKYPASTTWRLAARYCNWLHNGKGTGPSAFEDGAYDASTFYETTDGLADQATHHARARYWLPTLDEWIKAAYYDPDRYGAGVEGYWLHPDGGNEPLVSGYPAEGGETSAGIDGLYTFPVLQYPHVASPLGLRDLSGGDEEWTETVKLVPWSKKFRSVVSSSTYDDWYYWEDQLDNVKWGAPTFTESFRVCAMVDACVADCNADDRLDVLDLVCFQEQFRSGHPAADLNGDGMLNVLDFVEFQKQLAAREGCARNNE